MSEEQLIPTPSVFGDGGNFILERELGRGGMGAVYMGRDKMLDRPVAVKVMLREYGSDPEFVGKFKKEAQAVAKLIHPNIAQVYSYGIYDGMPYIAMELVAGGSLDQLMKTAGANMDVPRTMKICEQVAQALRCAADQGLVHGDVKPENILLDANGNAKLVDFGLAAMAKDTGEIWGTPFYIAPEKVRKQPVDYRADMYSLGGTIYHALCGVPPFDGEDAVAVVKARFMGPAKKPSQVRSGLSPQIDFFVMKLLAMEPTDRYPSFEALLEDYKKVMTTGLNMTGPLSTTKSINEAAAPAPKAAAGGGKKLMIKGKKKPLAMKPKTAAETDSSADAVPPPPEEEEEEGGMGVKVILTIVAVVGAIALVFGGLAWYKAADKKARAAELQAQIDANLGKARTALHDTRNAAVKFADEFDAFAKEAISYCEGPTEEMRKLLSEGGYPQSVLDMLQPPRPVEKKEEPAAPATTNAAPAQATAPAVAATPAAEPAPAAEAEAPAAPEKEVPSVVHEVADLWMKAYGCEAAAKRVRTAITGLLEKIDTAEKIQVVDAASLQRFVETANTLKEEYDQIKASPDVTKTQKDKPTIKSRGKKFVNETMRRMREEAAQKAREEAKKAALEKEKAEAEAKAAAKAKQIEDEVAAAKAAYEKVVNDGKVRQLDWTGAYRMLTAARAEMKTPQGQLELDRQRGKIECMELMQKVLVDGLKKGFTFTRTSSKDVKINLKGAKVTKVTMKSIEVQRPKLAHTDQIVWQSFYDKYHNNLDEIISRYIIKSGAVPGVKRLSKKDRFNATMGAAFIMRIVCADNPTALAYSEKLVKDAVKDFPQRFKDVKEYFPDIDYSDIAAEVEEAAGE